MAWALVGSATHYDSNSSDSAVITKPTGTAEDDILFCHLKHLVNEAPNSVPTGWTLVADFFDSTSTSYYSIYYKVAGASEGASYTFGYATLARLGATIVTFRDGFNTSDPIDVSSNTHYEVSNTTNRAADMTVTAANSPLIFFGGVNKSASTITQTPPTSPDTFVEHTDQWDSGSRFAREISSVVWSSSGATGDMDSTLSETSPDKHAMAVALNPSAGGASGTDVNLHGTGRGIARGVARGIG